MTQSHPLTLGVELELELCPKPDFETRNKALIKMYGNDKRYDVLAAIVRTALDDIPRRYTNLNTTCLAHGTPEFASAVEDKSIHSSWKIMSEGIELVDPRTDNWIVEVCSRAFSPKAHDPRSLAWYRELLIVWRAIERNFVVKQNPGCGTYIHFKHTEGVQKPSELYPEYSLQELRGVVKGIILWEEAIAFCIPKFRRHNANAQSNISQKPGPRPKTEAAQDFSCLGLGLESVNFGTLFEKIENLKSTDELADYLGASKGLRVKHLAWNFAHLKEGNIKTIEFRRPPMCHDFEAVAYWITFVASFAAIATQVPFAPWASLVKAPQVGEIESYLKHGVGDVDSGVNYLKIQEFAQDDDDGRAKDL